MKIKQGRRIQIECQHSDKEWSNKWVNIDDIIRRINHIKDVIRQCSWEDEFGEQTLHYSDLHNLLKILESELNKPEVNHFELSQEYVDIANHRLEQENLVDWFDENRKL